MIHPTWFDILNKHHYDFEFNTFPFYEMLNEEGKNIYPLEKDRLKVLEMSVYDIKIVFLGQDPYHQKGQANGFSFSVDKNVEKIPPSLKNIFKEIKDEFPERKYKFSNGDIGRWFYDEKIFLLNASLSVLEKKPGSHMKYWEWITNDIIQFISEQNEKAIFMLLGNFAKSKRKLIKNQENIIEGVHPSPLSAHNGFFQSKLFLKAEEKVGRMINWGESERDLLWFDYQKKLKHIKSIGDEVELIEIDELHHEEYIISKFIYEKYCLDNMDIIKRNKYEYYVVFYNDVFPFETIEKAREKSFEIQKEMAEENPCYCAIVFPVLKLPIIR